MAKRRETSNRLTLFRACGTCGKHFTTTAATPWMRVVDAGEGKQRTAYFCSEGCFVKSYKRPGWYGFFAGRKPADGEAADAERARKRRYYEQNRKRLLEKARERAAADPEEAKKDNAFYRKKRKLMGQNVD